MADKQPEAIRLADSLERAFYPSEGDTHVAAAELRRQHALIAELVGALEVSSEALCDLPLMDPRVVTIRAALAKAKEQK